MHQILRAKNISLQHFVGRNLGNIEQCKRNLSKYLSEMYCDFERDTIDIAEANNCYVVRIKDKHVGDESILMCKTDGYNFKTDGWVFNITWVNFK